MSGSLRWNYPEQVRGSTVPVLTVTALSARLTRAPRVVVVIRHHSEVTPAIKLLEARKVAHRTVSYDHDPAADSYGNEAAEALGIDPSLVFKTLLTTVDAQLVVAVVPVSSMLDLKALARAAAAKKAVMADPTLAERTTGYVLGGISPLGQRKQLPTFIDESALALDEIYVSGGRRGLEIALAPTDLVAVLDATTAPIAAN